MAILSRALSALAVFVVVAAATTDGESTCTKADACDSQADDVEEVVALQTNVKEHQTDKESGSPRNWPKGWCPCTDNGHGRIGTCLTQPVQCGPGMDNDPGWNSRTVYGCCGMKDQTKCNNNCNCGWKGYVGALGTCMDGNFGCCDPQTWNSC
mmetsp:Transcript_29047/g.63088  ORF Transcript_29047/g.63088 Transcript_29047/m.63088 type:complete len:153 (+) Transcript_29047:180-638(+)